MAPSVLVPALLTCSKSSSNSDTEQPETPPVRSISAFRKRAFSMYGQARGSPVSADSFAEHQAFSGEITQPSKLTRHQSAQNTSQEDAEPSRGTAPTNNPALLSQLSLRDRGAEHLHKTFGLPESEVLRYFLPFTTLWMCSSNPHHLTTHSHW